MRNTLVPVYYGLTAGDAQGLADALQDIGVESFADSTESPIYGVRSGPGGNVLLVRSPVTGQVREAIRRYELEGHPQVATDGWPREEKADLMSSDRPEVESAEEFRSIGSNRLAAQFTELDEEPIDELDLVEWYTEEGEDKP